MAATPRLAHNAKPMTASPHVFHRNARAELPVAVRGKGLDLYVLPHGGTLDG